MLVQCLKVWLKFDCLEQLSMMVMLLSERLLCLRQILVSCVCLFLSIIEKCLLCLVRWSWRVCFDILSCDVQCEIEYELEGSDEWIQFLICLIRVVCVVDFILDRQLCSSLNIIVLVWIVGIDRNDDENVIVLVLDMQNWQFSVCFIFLMLWLLILMLSEMYVGLKWWLVILWNSLRLSSIVWNLD